MTTVYQHCADAIRRLTSNGEPFTDLDAVTQAAQPSWTEEDYRTAMIRANQIVQAFYKDGKLVRYGPVRLPDGTQDYVRYSARIVHASPTGRLATLSTPNGDFPRLLSINDSFAGAGRRKGTNRDDQSPWPKGEDTNPQVEALQRQLNDALRRIHDLEQKDRRLAKVLGA